MKRYLSMVTTLWVTLVFCCIGNVSAQSPELDSAETDTLIYLREFAHLKWDIFQNFSRISEENNPDRHPMWASLAADAAVHSEELKFNDILIIDFKELKEDVDKKIKELD